MEVKLKVSNNKKFRTLVEIMSTIPPYSNLRSREKDVLASLYELNYLYTNLPLEQREMLIFNKSHRHGIAATIGISPDSFYNLTMDLRKKGLLGKDCFIEKYIIGNTNEVTFKLTEKE